MKYFTKNRILFLLPLLGCGVGCMLLRFAMMVYGFDGKGLLEAGQPFIVLSWVLVLAYLILLYVGIKHLGSDGTYEQVFARSRISGCTLILSGILMIVANVQPIPMYLFFFGMIAGMVMMITGFYRILGRRPHGIFNLILCFYFAVRLIGAYRTWSVDPQLQDYAFQILASVMLMLAAFHRSFADSVKVQRRPLIFTGLSAAFFALVSISDPISPLYYGACFLWAVGGAGSLEKIPGNQQKENTL